LVTAAGIGREFLVQTATPGTPVDVLDCAGRRVTRLARLPCRWGLGAAPGVYFLRSNRSGSTRVTLVGPSGPNRD
jgi:hypothetical protein